MQIHWAMRRGLLQIELLLFAAGAAGVVNAQTTAQKLLWHDPGDVSKIDLGGSVGTGIGAPKPPFTFVKEDMSGTQPKVEVIDGTGRKWVGKFGNEVKPECFAWRIPVAAGYYVEPSYYIASGQFLNLGAMQRKTPSIQGDGHFKDARFQIRDPNFKYLDNQSWKWAGNPFAGSRELKGLEILIMLASNWDNKDGTAAPGDSNTGIFERVVNGRREWLYSFTDWGSGMGFWGDKGGQSDWACADYTRQTSDFVKGVVKGQVVFGYEGHHNDDFKTNIRPSDVAWLMKYLGQLRDDQLRAALQASGATSSEVTCFTRAIRTRINQLTRVSSSP